VPRVIEQTWLFGVRYLEERQILGHDLLGECDAAPLTAPFDALAVDR
jgi:hypothetical protein